MGSTIEDLAVMHVLTTLRIECGVAERIMSAMTDDQLRELRDSALALHERADSAIRDRDRT